MQLKDLKTLLKKEYYIVEDKKIDAFLDYYCIEHKYRSKDKVKKSIDDIIKINSLDSIIFITHLTLLKYFCNDITSVIMSYFSYDVNTDLCTKLLKNPIIKRVFGNFRGFSISCFHCRRQMRSNYFIPEVGKIICNYCIESLKGNLEFRKKYQLHCTHCAKLLQPKEIYTNYGNDYYCELCNIFVNIGNYQYGEDFKACDYYTYLSAKI